jgi:hypothetical protein
MHLQQSGGLSAGRCPSGQAAQRTVEQSTFALSPPAIVSSPVPAVLEAQAQSASIPAMNASFRTLFMELSFLAVQPDPGAWTS